MIYISIVDIYIYIYIRAPPRGRLTRQRQKANEDTEATRVSALERSIELSKVGANFNASNNAATASNKRAFVVQHPDPPT